MKNLSQASILVADSDSEALFTIASILVARDHRVLTAKNANEAIRHSTTETLDLLITDERLSDGSGLELISLIRQEPSKSDLPVMFVSSNQMPGVIRRTNESGSAFHVKKPIDTLVLCELVEKALWMPHLIRNHIEQKTVKQPHVSFAKNPLADPFTSNSVFPGTSISY